MKIYRSSIRSGVPLTVDEEITDWKKEEFAKTYPLLGISKAKIQGQFEKCKDIVTFNGVISGTLILADARTNEPFEFNVESKDIIDLLENGEDENGEGYIFPGNGIEVRDVVYSVLRSETPIKPLKKGSKLPRGGEGWSACEEGEFEEVKSSPFDVLADYNFDTQDSGK